MSKTGAPRRFRIEKYIDEAVKAPFVLDLDDDTSIEIAQPSTNEVAAMPATATPRDALRVFTSSDADADTIMGVFGDLPAGALMGLVRDIREHFGLGG